ncbi:amino acid ABC transporter permease [Bifidobacterium apri]|uniref:Amino acid ABC transporter permease n=1 Tax=Bifidobacterium apri TaxID=1769423 RepID=A0A6A2VB89_9BIFI|nr:amino acid ABC transporter permease [Bifidobacterium apri]KAB8301971.1 amino acid ABC transporter permease [Bifidobacterium apri]
MPDLFNGKLVFTQIPQLLRYLPVTLELTLAAGIIGLVLGFIIALIRVKRTPVLYQISTVYISVLRGTPIIVQLYISYFGIPIFLKYLNYWNGTDWDINNVPPVLFAILALAFNQSAFMAEVIRAAITAVDSGQLEAARSLGMSPAQVRRRVILPQAGVIALPGLMNSLIGLIKGTSLAFVCAVVDMTAAGQIMAGSSYRYFEMYCSLAIIYWVITLVLERAGAWLEHRLSVPEQAPALRQVTEAVPEQAERTPSLPERGTVRRLPALNRQGITALAGTVGKEAIARD